MKDIFKYFPPVQVTYYQFQMRALFAFGRRGIGIGFTACVGAGATALFVSSGPDSNASASGSGSNASSVDQFAGLDDERRSQLFKPKVPYPQWDDNWCD